MSEDGAVQNAASNRVPSGLMYPQQMTNHLAFEGKKGAIPHPYERLYCNRCGGQGTVHQMGMANPRSDCIWCNGVGVR